MTEWVSECVCLYNMFTKNILLHGSWIDSHLTWISINTDLYCVFTHLKVYRYAVLLFSLVQTSLFKSRTDTLKRMITIKCLNWFENIHDDTWLRTICDQLFRFGWEVKCNRNKSILIWFEVLPLAKWHFVLGLTKYFTIFGNRWKKNINKQRHINRDA